MDLWRLRTSGELRLLGYVVERIVGSQDKFVVCEVVQHRSHSYRVYGETSGDFEEFLRQEPFNNDESPNWFCARNFSSAKRQHASVIFVYYNRFSAPSPLFTEFSDAVAYAVSLSGGMEPIYDRKDA